MFEDVNGMPVHDMSVVDDDTAQWIVDRLCRDLGIEPHEIVPVVRELMRR